MDRTKAGKIHTALDNVLHDVAERFGLAYKPGRLTYSASGIRTTIQFIPKIAEDDAENPYARFTNSQAIDAFKSFASFYDGFEASDIFTTFTTSNGEQYVIVGYSPKRRKYPVSVVRVRDNAQYKFTSEEVSRSLDRLKEETKREWRHSKT